jgi:glycosyltransferase involved in cell wall biosynthesis
MISILILTLNEERNLLGCLNSVSWSDDIVVFDSFSTDKTVEIAKEAGARVVQRKFDNWAAHQNWAMTQIPFKHPWVFYLDADERMRPELKDELFNVCNNPKEARVAFYCGRRNFFMDKWIRHAYPPSHIMRFFKPDKIRFERLVNPTPVIDGAWGYLTQMFDHYNFSKGLTEWFDKHNKYSQMEAMEGAKLLAQKNENEPSLFSRDQALRRKALKNLSVRMPFRPLIKFCYLYFWKFGFLDGRAGLTYCMLQAIYEYMIVLKMLEIQQGMRTIQKIHQ